MSANMSESATSKYRYEILFGVWLAVTGATFLRIKRQPYSTRLKIEQYESIFKGTSLGAVLIGIGITPARSTARRMLLWLGSSSVEFSMWNPAYAVAPFVLLMVSIPLAIFAVVTSSVALSLLSLRALAVYMQLAVAVVGAWLSPPPLKYASPYRRSLSPTSARQSPTRQRHRRSSSGSAASTQGTAAHTSRLTQKSGSLTSLIGTSELTRDFEGMGGWRMTGDEDEEALWMGINSRLELPADVPARRHRRSLTGGGTPSQRWSFSPEPLRMSPAQSRATPVRFAIDDEHGYFPSQSTLAVSGTRHAKSKSDPVKQSTRRKSGSGNSTSSNASAGMMMAVKEAGE
ncbi:hypothetical protein EJ02DRAFT_407746 [Clathrospora elynae]|uniref:Uncharacterized protein n=1 Tax=Clathrospora elynae TaxID=706981 RepID=A0A6A5SGL5_9PLEO|nr:hypothetical protein EJ02DRAFT_407746 [Clathrospora elynae]